MEDLIKLVIDNLGPKASAALGAVALAGVIIPYLVKVRDAWREARTDKRVQAAERERLELIKLWLEVEALRKQHDITPPFPIPPPVLPAPVTSDRVNIGSMFGRLTSTASHSEDHAGVWRWLAALESWHRMWSTSILFLLGIVALPCALFGFVLMVMMWLDLNRNRMMADVAGALFMTASELMCVLFVRALHRQYTLLTVARHVAAGKGPEA
ncbi:MAG: hypothetical protein RL514_3202 [Verrucomicrobiota bacterium]